MWHVSSRCGVATLRTALYLLLVTYLHDRSLKNDCLVSELLWQITPYRQQSSLGLAVLAGFGVYL